MRRRGWAAVIGLAGVGGVLSAVATLIANLPVVTAPLAVAGTVLAAVGGALSITTAKPVARNTSGVTFGVIPKQAAWFQQRPSEQDALVNALGRKGKAALVALPGARGAGKSQLAAAYARQCVAAGFDLVAWINAENGPVAELALLGERLGLRSSEDQPAEQLAALAVAEVADGGGRRLLVFDNVEDPDSVRDFLPATGTAKVLITSNRREVTSMAEMVVIDVGMFTPPQGRALLSAATGLPDTDDAQKVGEMLGWLPLGVAQAGAYIKLNTISYRQYLQRLDRVDVDEALARQAGTPHVGVLQAVTLSMATADRLDPLGNARRVLAMLCMLAPEGTPREWLTRPEALARLDIAPAGMDKALTVLSNTSLINQTAAPQHPPDVHDPVVAGVHRLIAKIVRHHAATTSGYQDAIDDAAAILRVAAGRLPRHQAALRRAELEQLVTHILAVRSHTQQYSQKLDWLGDWAANNLKDVGDFSRAISIHHTLLTESQQAFGADHPNTLVSRNNLAGSYSSAGRYDEAITLEEQTLTDRERVLGPDHPHTLTSRNNLANSYRSAGRHDEAITLHEQNLADRERVLGADHPDTLRSRNNLANSYQAASRHDEAITLHERNLANSERVLGADHPDTLNSRNNLAISYQAAGRHDEAENLDRRDR